MQHIVIPQLYSNESLDDFQDLFDDLEQEAISWSKTRDLNFEERLRVDQEQKIVSAIISVTGDDEIQTTDSQVLPILHFVAGKVVSGVRLSEKDTGISSRKGNYTEGWIILAPNREATFDSVYRRHQNSGVPLTLDIPKLKQASAVRKQTSLEMDLESKFSDLFKSAEWIDRDWLTYDYSQLHLVFATAIFDFQNAFVFPFLYKTEGGCGGKPPWNNIDTVISGLFYYRRGKAKDGILGIMDESYLIQKDKMEPKDSIFLQSSHMAQCGNRDLSRLISFGKISKNLDLKDKLDLLNSCSEEPLPKELLDKGVTIEPKNRLIGCAISHLRKNGLVMTELDVRLKLVSEHKTLALMGRENMGQFRLAQEDRIKIAKRDRVKILSLMVDGEKLTSKEINRKVINDYYSARSNRDDITALSYSGLITVFKTTDVLKLFMNNSAKLSDEIIASLDHDLVDRAYTHSKISRDSQLDWVKNHSLTDLLEVDLPSGIGPDDARITRKILKLQAKLNKLTVFIVTDDRKMIESLRAIMKDSTIIYRITRSTYFRSCASRRDNVYPKVLSHYRMEKECACSYVNSLLNVGDKFIILYDYPNIERMLEDWDRGVLSIDRRFGGYLQRKTVQKNPFWAQTEWDTFRKWPDFKVRTKAIRY